MKPESSKNMTPAPQDAAYTGENLIFLISQPRSGSTLLQRLLAGHPDIQTSAETWLMLHPVYGLRAQGIETEYRADWAATGVSEFLDNYADGRETYLSGIRSFAQTIYGNVLSSSGKKYFLDKTPRYTMIVPELVELFPAARFVLLFRNPLAVLSSELRTYIGDKYWKLADYSPDLLDAPRRLVEARRFCGERGISVHYEALVAEPEHTIRQICRHLEIDFADDMLDYGDRPAPFGRMNDPVGIHQHSRPTIDSLRKWQELGRNSQHRAFALAYLDELGTETLAALGYDLRTLESEIETSRIDIQISPTYPWRLAMTPKKQQRFRDRLFATYCIATHRRGRLSGVYATLSLLANKSIGPLRRLLRKTDPKPREQPPGAFNSKNDGREASSR